MFGACVCWLSERLHVLTGEKPTNLAQAREAGTHPWIPARVVA